MKFFSYGFKVCINYKWNSQLFMEVIEFQYVVVFCWHFNRLCAIYLDAVFFVINQYFFRIETLKTMHAEMFPLFVLCLIVHELVEMCLFLFSVINNKSI